MSKNLKGKSYNDVMNEWAAQRSFLQRAGSGMLRPGYGATGLSRIFGWTWRLGLLAGLPLLGYVGALRFHAKSTGFATQLAAETKRFLGAESVKFRRTRWDLNGELKVENLKATGSPQNYFSALEINNLYSVIKIPAVFKPAWHLERVRCFSASMDLRSGGGKSVAHDGSSTSSEFLAAGWGISPDFSKLTIDSYECDKLNLKWGSSPSTTGVITGSKAAMARDGEGWALTFNGGSFQQGWTDSVNITSAAVSLKPGSMTIDKGDITLAGGCSGTVTGTMTFGEAAAINAEMKLANVQFHSFLPQYFQRFVKATAKGTVQFSGSTSAATGVTMDASFTLQAGAISGVPVFRALELATGENQLAQPEITGGTVRFKSQGTTETGGILIEADEVLIESGTRMKLALNLRHERKQVMATNVTEAALAQTSVALSTEGTLRVGLPPETVAKMKPAIREEFFTRQDQGMVWMEIPFKLEEEKGEFTKTRADRIVQLHTASK